MTLGTMQNWDTRNVLAGGIDLGDREGVHCRTFASPVADPRIPAAVYHSAECFLCEWVYRPGEQRVPWEGLEAVAYKYDSPDMMDVLTWVGVHRTKGSHARAFDYFKKERWLRK